MGESLRLKKNVVVVRKMDSVLEWVILETLTLSSSFEFRLMRKLPS